MISDLFDDMARQWLKMRIAHQTPTVGHDRSKPEERCPICTASLAALLRNVHEDALKMYDKQTEQ